MRVAIECMQLRICVMMPSEPGKHTDSIKLQHLSLVTPYMLHATTCMTIVVRHLTRSVSVLQLEEELQDDLKWCMLTEKILHVEKSKFQDVELVVTGPFGKVRRLMRHAAARGTQ